MVLSEAVEQFWGCDVRPIPPQPLRLVFEQGGVKITRLDAPLDLSRPHPGNRHPYSIRFDTTSKAKTFALMLPP
ncbi:MAG: hypothetical protein NW237_12340 [Cyanobacteriota bacterium]|nr:hypothetical protein [Cyanobacteriota bacterium]